MELCTPPILVQKEQIELTRYLYTQLLESDWYSDITLFGHITIFVNAYVSRNTNYGQNHYLVPFFKNLIQALKCIPSKREGKQIQNGGTI